MYIKDTSSESWVWLLGNDIIHRLYRSELHETQKCICIACEHRGRRGEMGINFGRREWQVLQDKYTTVCAVILIIVH